MGHQSPAGPAGEGLSTAGVDLQALPLTLCLAM